MAKVKWVKKVSQDNFLSNCLVSDNIPESLDVELSMRGVESADVVNEHCIFLAKVCRYLDPIHVFEIGTHFGKYATICGLNSNALITTTCIAKEYNKHYIDIGKQHSDILPMAEIGKLYEINELQSRVRQAYANSNQMELHRFYDGKQIDLAIINGAHDPAFVFHDTVRVMEHLRDDGVILWDNFVPEWANASHVKGVMDGLKNLEKQLKIKFRWIEGTGWAGWVKK